MDEKKTGTLTLKTGLAEMLKGGVIMDVTTPEQARIAEDAGAVAVMALERVPADIRRDGGVARMADPEIVAQMTKLGWQPVPKNSPKEFEDFIKNEIETWRQVVKDAKIETL